MIKVNESNWLSEIPSEKELTELSMDDLLEIFTTRWPTPVQKSTY